MADELPDIAPLIDSLAWGTGANGWIDTATRPADLDRIGAFIARTLGARTPQAVACWLAEDDVVLAHAVALHLGVPVLRLQEDLGRLGFVPDRGLRVTTAAVVAPAWTTSRQSATLIAFLHNCGIAVTAAVSLIPGAEPPHAADGVQRIVLASPHSPADAAATLR